MVNVERPTELFSLLNLPKFLLSHSESVSTVLISCDAKPYTVGFLAKIGPFRKAQLHERFFM